MPNYPIRKPNIKPGIISIVFLLPASYLPSGPGPLPSLLQQLNLLPDDPQAGIFLLTVAKFIYLYATIAGNCICKSSIV